MNRLLSFGASSWVLLICFFMTGSIWSQQAPPSVTSVVLNGGDAQRSMIKSVTLTFSDDVGASLQAEDLNIVNASTNTAITGAVLAYDSLTRIGTWTFPAEIGKSLPDGVFSIFIRPADVVGAGGQLVANPGTTLWSDKFFRYFGDFDGDRDVDFLDTSKFRKTYTRTATTSPAEFNAAADADDNGIVDATDLALFQAHYLSVVPGELTPPTLINPPVRTTQRTVTLSGNSAPNSRVLITNGFFVYEGVAGADGSFAIVVGLLSDRINYLLVSGDGLTSQDPSKLVPVTITQDSTPPFLYIDYPSEGATLATNTVTVTGRVGDTLSGFTGMAVNVNGVTASVTAGIGPNGTYEARNVPLVLGENFIFVTASDILGTAVSRGITINRIAQSQIEIVSGDEQSAIRNSELPQPIIVRVKDTNGQPFADKIVNFEIKRSDGRVNAIQGATFTEETVTTQARTNAQGLAQVFWRLGSDAGKSNNLLCAVSAGIPGQVFFRANALCRPATQINVGMGNNQVGEAGATAALPLTAWVSDDLNGCENVPVTFTVTSGDAKVNGGTTFTRNTDSSGHVDAILKFGPTGGPVTVEATHAGNQGVPAVFNSRALVRTPGAPTVFKAVVQDNTGQPIGGAACTLNVNGVRFPSVNSADDGTFTITGVTPGSGFVQVDGRTATTLGGQFFDQVGRFPSLVYRVNIVPNAENALPVTVYLPTLNPVNERTYNGTQDVELTIEGIAGLKMRIKAGSMTLSNGTKPSLANPVTVSLNQVHSDNIPMPIQDGVAPLLTWTLQPASAKFSPPVEIEYPNMTGLAPGSATNFLSYNHDIERFEIVASATVSADGAIIKSDPGTGLTSSGWGCNCPPYSATGTCKGQGGPGDSGPDGIPGTNDDGDSSDTPGPDTSTGGDPVLLASGEFVLTETDLQVPGRGLSFQWQRTYRSQFNYNGTLGYNWDHAYNKRLQTRFNQNQDVRLCNGFARLDTYLRKADGSYVSPKGFYDELRRNSDGTYTLRDRHGLKTNFDATGLMRSQVDRNGNTLAFEYTSGRLTAVIDPLGRRYTIAYNNKSRIASVTDFSGRQVIYTYNNIGDLASVRSPVITGTSNGNDFPNGKLVSYTYDNGFSTTDPKLQFLNHNLTSITDPKGQTYLINEYQKNPASYEFDKVVRQQWGTNAQICDFNKYEPLNPAITNPGPNDPKVRTTKIDRNGNTRVATHNAFGRLLEDRIKTNRNINPDDRDEFITTNTYNADGELTSTTHPDGNRETYTFDESNTDRLQRGNLLAITKTPGVRGGDQAQIRENRSYEPIFNQVRTVTEARGNDSTFVPQNGGANSASRYTRTLIYDYQEGASTATLAAETGRSVAQITSLLAAAGVNLGLGDVNGDGLTNQTLGNVIQRRNPSVRLLNGSSQTITTDYAFNSFGQIISETDPEGNVDEFIYYPEADPDGDGTATATLGLNATTGGYLFASIKDSRVSARRTSTVPPALLRNEAYYDPVGNITRTVDPRGNDTLVEVNALNQVIKRTSPAPFRFQHVFFYDGNNNITREEIQNVDTNGPNLDGFVTYTYEYNILDHMTTRREEVSTTTTLTTRYEYDRNENLTKTIYPEGNSVVTVYDERNMPFSATRGFGTPDASTTYRTYDGSGNLVKFVDAQDAEGDGLPEVTLQTFDGYNRKTSHLDAIGNRKRWIYDAADNVLSERCFGPNGGPSRDNNGETGNVLLAHSLTAYDELSRPFQVDQVLFSNIAPVGPEGPLTPSDGKVTSRSFFDRNGRVVRAVDDNNNATLIEFDGADRPVKRTDALGNEVATLYDANSNVERVTETEKSPENTVPAETFVSQYQYDSLNRLTLQTDSLNNTVSFIYDSRNNRIRTTDKLGNITRQIFDGLNRELQTIQELRVGGIGAGAIDTSNASNPDGLITTTKTWDGNSRLATITDDNGNVTRYGYDSLNRRTTETFADTTISSVVYDKDDNVASRTDQNGNVFVHTYDGINRLVTLEITRGAGIGGTTLQTFEYDGLSRQTLATDDNDPLVVTDDSAVEMRYDSLSRTLQQIQDGVTVGNRFDGVGNRVAATYPNNRVVETSYDALNRIDRITNQAGGSLIADYDYIGTSRVLERRFGNGTKLRYHDGAGHDTGYDGLRRPVSERQTDAANTLIAGYGYAFDRMSNRRFESDLRTSTADVYQYDSSYRLSRTLYSAPVAALGGIANNTTTNADVTALTTPVFSGYTLDGVGNWTTRTGAGGPTAFVPNNMNEYASVGGVAQTNDDNGNLTNDGTQRFFYDAFNRLTRVTATVGGAEIARYRYDALNRRASSTIAAAVTQFLYDGLRVIEERSSGTTLRQFVFGRALDGVLALTSGSQTHFYHSNSIGSVVALTDSTGAVSERYDYDDFGKTRILAPDGVAARTQSAIGNPYSFTGQRFDVETGLYYYKARYYSPETGRFLQRDPMGYKDGMGLYAYVGNNPINFTDPFGLEKNWWDDALDWLQGGLDIAGLIPGAGEPFDLLNAAIYAARGDALNAGLSAAGAIPFAGWGATGAKMAGKYGDEIVGAAAKYGDDIAGTSKGPVGSYTNTHASGNKYHGKGTEDRMNQSGKEKATKYDDPVVSQDFKPAANDRDAFKDEARRIREDGGIQNPNNYNKINSPGEKYLRQDGE